MDPDRTARARASIVGRARFIEDLVEAQLALGVTQYVILGAGLDTFAQRRPDLAARMRVFEVDQPGRQSTEKFARLAGTPMISFFTPEEMLSLAHRSGFRSSLHVSSTDLAQRYFNGRSDGLRPSSSEELIVATTE